MSEKMGFTGNWGHLEGNTPKRKEAKKVKDLKWYERELIDKEAELKFYKELYNQVEKEANFFWKTIENLDEEIQEVKHQNELYRNELKKLAEKANDEKNNSEYRLGLLRKQITKCTKLEDDLFEQKIVINEKEEMIKFYKVLNSINNKEKNMLIENIKELDEELTEIYTLKSEYQDRLNDVLAWNKQKDNEIVKLHGLLLGAKNSLYDIKTDAKNTKTELKRIIRLVKKDIPLKYNLVNIYRSLYYMHTDY